MNKQSSNENAIVMIPNQKSFKDYINENPATSGWIETKENNVNQRKIINCISFDFI